MRANLRAIRVRALTRNAVEKNLGAMVLFNLSQLNRGETPAAKKMYPMYAWQEYAAFKHRKNPLPGEGTPDLRMTGAFYKSISAKLQNNEIIMKSTDPKAPWLEDHYGPDDIYGLTEENKAQWTEFVREDFQKSVESVTGLRIN